MGKEKRNKEFIRIEKRIGFRCSELGCDWEIKAKNNQNPPELYEALPIFGKHNVNKHGGRIDVRMVPIIKI